MYLYIGDSPHCYLMKHHLEDQMVVNLQGLNLCYQQELVRTGEYDNVHDDEQMALC